MPILRSLAALLLVAALLPAQPVYQPKIGKASRDGLRAISGFTIDAGFERKLWAAEPMLANPVCLWVDARGRVFVGETFRQEQGGVPDNRSFSYWKDDDLKNQTLADRRAMYLTHRPHFAMQFTEHHDRIRLLQDTNGNGKADKASVFADGFNDILDGTGAGILARGNDVYYTCIPNVWRLRDVNGDGKVDRREILHTGYGIRIALRGHDLHGLVMGPDGRLYFSIGDRGYNITTDDGRVLKCPWSGAVFRCELDGSGLEVFATGLRNPQELAFDDLGNLFTGDNNSDSQDQARLVYVVEGGETGWRMNFQYKSDRGGWVSEGWWKTRHEGQAAFLIPPMAHLGAGPSGFVLYPGTGLPASFAGTFFMCDFRGGRKQSGVRSFKLKPKGAGYELASDDRWLWGCLATDVDFGPDGTMFVSDWVHGWSGTGKGRIYTFRHQDADARRAGDETARLLAGDFGKMDVRALAALLGHADRRVRLEAQYALVAKGIDGGVVLLAQAKSASARRLVRIHGLWGVGQLQRQHGVDLTQELIPLFGDDDAEVAAQAIRVCGEAQNVHATGAMVQALGAASARVRYFAALELGRVGSLHDVEAVVAMIRENANADVYLRHAGVMALTGIGSADALLARAGDPSPAVRLAILLALRRLKDVRVRRFLADADGYVATAAARALYDVPIEGGYGPLASLLKRTDLVGAPLTRRAIASAEQLAQDNSIVPLFDFAAREDAPAALRVEALSALLEWDRPREFERILNMWRPRDPGSRDAVARIAERRLSGLLSSGPVGVRRVAAQMAGHYGIRSAAPALLAQVESNRSGPARIACLRALAELRVGELDRAIALGLAAKDGRLRGEAAAILSRISPEKAVDVIGRALSGSGIAERQIGLDTLGRLGHPRGDKLLVASMDRLLAGDLEKSLWLETLDSSRRRGAAGVTALADRVGRFEKSLDPKNPVAKYLPSLHGGDPARGRKVFLNKSETSCRRCHQIGKFKPTDATQMAGPELTKIAAQRDRMYLLRAVANPNLDTADGFAAWLVETNDDDVYRGRVISENDTQLVIEVKEVGEPVEQITVKKKDIRHRSREKSAMPEDLITKLSPRELRDLIAFLANQK